MHFLGPLKLAETGSLKEFHFSKHANLFYVDSGFCAWPTFLDMHLRQHAGVQSP